MLSCVLNAVQLLVFSIVELMYAMRNVRVVVPIYYLKLMVIAAGCLWVSNVLVCLDLLSRGVHLVVKSDCAGFTSIGDLNE